MAITLGDVAQHHKDPLTKGSLELFLKEKRLAQFVPKKAIDTMVARVMRETELPTMEWRDLGNGFGESKGKWDFVEETVYSMGRRISVDHLIEKDKRLTVKPRPAQLKLFSKSAAYEFDEVFLRGDSDAVPNQPMGLHGRIAKLDPDQTVDAGTARLGGDGTMLDLSTAATRDSNAKAVIDVLNAAIDQCAGGEADVILMNLSAHQAIHSALMRSNLLAHDKDQFGRTLPTYRGAKLIEVGKKRDRKTPLIPNAESGESGTSIYVARLGEDYFHLLEYLPYEVRDLGLLEDGVTFATVVEWAWGIANPHPEAGVRIKNVKVA